MKKTIFLGIAVLLALAMFSCGDPIALSDDGNVGGITLTGPELAAGRSLVGATSEAGANYYEATFQRLGDVSPWNPVSPAKIARTKWGYARKGRIQLEPGYYKVVLMAGRSVDATLLGVGRASSIVETDGLTGIPGTATSIAYADGLRVQIRPTTSDLFFTVYALQNNIIDTGTSGNGTDPGISNSTFFTTLNTTPTSTYPLPSTKDELGNKVPVFLINQGSSTTATWKFGLGNLPGVAPGTATGDQITLFGPELLLKGAGALYETGFSYTDTYDVPQKLNDKSITVTSPITGTFNISVEAPNDDGMVQLALEVPVVAIAATDEPMTWFIRGGLNNGAIDAGVTPTYAKPGQIGGAVVLGFGNLSNFPVINLIPNHPFTATP